MVHVLVLAAAACGTASVQQPWLYAPVLDRGPADWGTVVGSDGKPLYPTCGAGAAQSPVNIAGAAADVNLKPLAVNYTAWRRYTVRNTQRAIELLPGGQEDAFLVDHNHHGARFNLTKIEFHSPSEHALGGGLTDLEMQLHHHVAPHHADKSAAHEVVVVSVLFKAGAAPNREFGFFSDLPGLPSAGFAHYEHPTHDLHVNEKVNPAAAAPFDYGAVAQAQGRYYTYTGSLTTPPCQEGVGWYVMQDVGVLSTQQLADIRKALGFDDELAHAALHGAVDLPPYTLFGNNRPLQKKHKRAVRASTACADRMPHAHDDDDTSERLSIAGCVMGSLALVVLLSMVLGTQAPAPHAHSQ
eukprot:TRINITY_DN22733_c0_g1_i1.p1 TRINITY_DN22733_c0_g1~~TRINITY_DN22733_c0_g1_i1.p1  ORF type:complete len:371 (+),score=108.82 TRINITY_DN22733_c0_g1_i1:49-1113(+)